MTFLQGLRLELRHEPVTVDVAPDLVVEGDEGLVLTDPVRHRSHLRQEIVEGPADLAHDGGRPGHVLDGLELVVGFADGSPDLLEIIELLDALGDGVAFGRVLQPESILGPHQVLLVGVGLLQTGFELRQQIHGGLRGHVSAEGLVLAPGGYQVDGTLGGRLFLRGDAGLQERELLLHGGDAAAQDLLDEIELSPDHGGLHPIVSEVEPLPLDETLGGLQLVELGSPRVDVGLHFLDEGDAQNDVFGSAGGLQGGLLEFHLGVLHLGMGILDALAEDFREGGLELLLPRVVLEGDLGLNLVVLDHDGPEFGGGRRHVDGRSGLRGFHQEGLPLFDVLSDGGGDVRHLGVPQGLVGQPLVDEGGHVDDPGLHEFVGFGDDRRVDHRDEALEGGGDRLGGRRQGGSGGGPVVEDLVPAALGAGKVADDPDEGMQPVEHQAAAGGNGGNRRNLLVPQQDLDGDGRDVDDGPGLIGIGPLGDDLVSVLVEHDGSEGVVPALEGPRQALRQDPGQPIVEVLDPSGQLGVSPQRHVVDDFLDRFHDGPELARVIVDGFELGQGGLDPVALQQELLDAFLELGDGIRQAGDPLGEFLGGGVPPDPAFLGHRLGGVQLDLKALGDDLAYVQQLRQDQGLEGGIDEPPDRQVRPEGRLDGDREGIPLLGFLAGPQNRPGDLLVEAEPLQLADFLGQGLGFFRKVHGGHQLVGPDVLLDDDGVGVEPRGGLDGQLLLPGRHPVAEEGLGVQLGQELVAGFAELPALQLGPPVGSQDLRAPFHQGVDLAFHLLGPEDLPRHGGDPLDLREPGRRGGLVLEDELRLELFDGLGDGRDELDLELLHGDADAGPGQQRVEAGEDPEHVLGVHAGRELVAEELRQAFLHRVHLEVVFLEGGFQGLGSARGQIQDVQGGKELAGGVLDRLDGVGGLVDDLVSLSVVFGGVVPDGDGLDDRDRLVGLPLQDLQDDLPEALVAGPELVDLFQAGLQRLLVLGELLQDLGGGLVVAAVAQLVAAAALLEEELLELLVAVVELDEDVLGGVPDARLVFLVVHEEEGVGVVFAEDPLHRPAHRQRGGRQELGRPLQGVVPGLPDLGQVVEGPVQDHTDLVEVAGGDELRDGVGLEEVLDVPGVGRGRVEARVGLQGQGGDEALGLPEHGEGELDARGLELRLDLLELVVELVPEGHFFQVGPLVVVVVVPGGLADHREGRVPGQDRQLADLADPPAHAGLEPVQVVVVRQLGLQAEGGPVDVAGEFLDLRGFHHPGDGRIDAEGHLGQPCRSLGLVDGHVQLADLVLEDGRVVGVVAAGVLVPHRLGVTLRGIGGRRDGGEEEVPGVELQGREEGRLAAGGLDGRKGLALLGIPVLVLGLGAGLGKGRCGRLERHALPLKPLPRWCRTGGGGGRTVAAVLAGFFVLRRGRRGRLASQEGDARLVPLREGLTAPAPAGAALDPHEEGRDAPLGRVGLGGLQHHLHQVLVGGVPQVDLAGHAGNAAVSGSQCLAGCRREKVYDGTRWIGQERKKCG